MNAMINKEFKLVMHPTNLMFFALSAMLLIPNYPYYVTFFYMTLGIFFACMSGRENNDVLFTANLPVRKKDVVKSRFVFIIIVEIVQVLIAVPFALIRNNFDMPGNQVGMDANIAFFGLAFIMIGIFNLIFFNGYYKNPDKIGKPFLISSIVMFLYMGIAEALDHVVPFMQDKLDTPDPKFLGIKIIVLFVGIAIYAMLTAVAYGKSVKKFTALDL